MNPCANANYPDFFALKQEANYYGSLTQSSTTSLGLGPDGREVYVPVRDLLPMVEPNDIHFDGELAIALYYMWTMHVTLTFLSKL